MKSVIHIILSLFLCTLFCQCNGDIFVKEFIPSICKCTLNGDSDSVTIQFSSGDWDVYTVYFTYGIDQNEGIWEFHSDEDAGSADPTIAWKGIGKGTYENEFTKIVIAREHYDQLKVYVDENCSLEPYELCIEMTNSFSSQTIYITVQPGTRYEVDRIEYDLTPLQCTNTYQTIGSYTIYNPYATPLSQNVHTFQYVARSIQFIQDTDFPFQILDINTWLPIPYYIEGSENQLTLSDEKRPYTPDIQTESGEYLTTKEITIPPYTQIRISLVAEVNEFWTNYTIYATNPQSKRQRTFKGTLHKTTKLNTDSYIIIENL